MDHKWLEDFVLLARERSFSKAAQLRHVTQPQFSRRIRALELWAGTDLVNRSGVPLGLTPAGEEFLPVARRVVSTLGDARARIRQSSQSLGWITLATGRTLSRTAVPAWLAKVKSQAGDFSLRIITGSIHEGATALEQGTADFLLSFSHPRLPLVLDERSFQRATLGTDELVAVCAARADGKPMHPLPGTPRKPVPVLGYAPTLALAHILQDGLNRAAQDRHLRTIIESDFAESLHEQALQGAGVAWLPRALVCGDLGSGRLVPAERGAAGMPFEICLYRSQAPRNALVDKVWEASTG